MALDYRTAIATGAGQFNLISCAFPCQSRLGEDRSDPLGIEGGVNRFNARGDAHRENAPLVEELSDFGIIDPHIAAHRVDGELSRRDHAINRGLSAIDQRLDIAGVIGVTSGKVSGKDEPDSGF